MKAVAAIGSDLPENAVPVLETTIWDNKVTVLQSNDVDVYYDVYSNGKLRHPRSDNATLIRVLKWYYMAHPSHPDHRK